MKRRLLIWFGLAAALLVQAALPAVPNLGNARIIVLANNLQNYYINYDESDRPSYSDDAGLALKTQRIADVMIASNADIFAFCELEAKPVTLEHLVAALNEQLDCDCYAAVYDGISVATDQYDNAIKSGFAYRKATVAPYGNNYAATGVNYYKNTMRIQAWEELSTGEKFTLSMNHFKAGQTAQDPGKRVTNAENLISGLSTSYKVKDPDILIMGDLNAQMSEDCIGVIEDAGFAEQLIRFDEDAYSYIYYGSHELIDHAFANSTMAEQITKAVVWHTNTAQSYSYRYSDHDAVLVGLRLGDEDPIIDGVEQVGTNPQVQKTMRHGQLIIIRGGIEYTITGQRL